MKPGVRLINGARGGIYDEAALVEGLKSGKLGGVALDVFENEPCTASPLFGMKNVVCTPHLGASTEEAQTQVAVEGVHLLVNFLTTGEIRHAVNVVAIQPQTLEALRGYLDVAYRLGRLLAQVHDGGLESCSLQYRGEVAEQGDAAADGGVLRRPGGNAQWKRKSTSSTPNCCSASAASRFGRKRKAGPACSVRR